MSLTFNDTSGGKGIIQTIEKYCGFNDGDVSGNPTLLKDFTADVNIAKDRALSLILKASGTWHFDDSNQTDYPMMTANIVSGQRDYSFTVDQSNNLVLDIFRVMVADSTGIYREIYPIDQFTPTNHAGNVEDTSTFIDNQNASGVPTRYSKVANGIFLDVIPNYSFTNGLKVFMDRETTYYTTSDTTKKSGFAGIFDEYLALRPSAMYATRKQLANGKDLWTLTTNMERSIQDYYSTREKDSPKRIWANVEQMT